MSSQLKDIKKMTLNKEKGGFQKNGNLPKGWRLLCINHRSVTQQTNSIKQQSPWDILAGY